jgi:TonB family protein
MRLKCIYVFLIFAASGVLSAIASEHKVQASYPIKDLGESHWSAAERAQFDTPPKLIRGSAPAYPIRQLQLANFGEATIEFTIGENGKARDFRVVSASYKSFADHAIIAVRDWQWEPARKHGRPVPVRVRIPFKYNTRSMHGAIPQIPN